MDSRRRPAARPASPGPADSPAVARDPDLVTLFCPTCETERLTETPPCLDGHGDCCPDRACVECGTALMFDAPLVDFALGRLPGRRASSRHSNPRGSDAHGAHTRRSA